MLQSLAADIMNCYERARQAREKAERAINAEFRAEFLAAESRWLDRAGPGNLDGRIGGVSA
jgi:hypothetical protein